MFAGIPAPIASDSDNKNTQRFSEASPGTLIIRPSGIKGQNAEYIDPEAMRYASDLRGRHDHKVSDLLSDRIDEIFNRAKPVNDEWSKVTPKKKQPTRVVEFPTLGKPLVSSLKIPEWGTNMVSLSRETIKKIGKDNDRRARF